MKEKLSQFLNMEEELASKYLDDDRFAVVRSALPTAVRHVETAREGHSKTMQRLSIVLYSALVLAPFALVRGWESWLGINDGIRLFVLGVIELIAGVLIYFSAHYSKRALSNELEASIIDKIWTYSARLVGGMCFLAALYVGSFGRHRYPGVVFEIAAGIGSLLAFYTLLTLAYASIEERLWLMHHLRRTTPSEVLLIDLLDLAVRATPGSWYYPTDRRSQRIVQPRHFIDHLELAAKHAEKVFPAVIPSRHDDLRLWALDRGRRVGAVLGAHKRILAETPYLSSPAVPYHQLPGGPPMAPPFKGLFVKKPPGSYLAMANSLVNGMACIARSDWEAFLVIQPEPAVQSFIRRFGTRVLLAALLTGSALVVPWLLPSLVPPEAAVQFRATLLVTAAFSLLRPDLDKAREALVTFNR